MGCLLFPSPLPRSPHHALRSCFLTDIVAGSLIQKQMITIRTIPLKCVENDDNFNVINEMVNGGDYNEAVQAKAEINAETGRRDVPSRKWCGFGDVE